jgi:transcriptional regulator with XRE-family HTH domain
VAKPIRPFRQARGLTQSEVARLLNVSEATAARWDRGEVTPRGKAKKKLARLLGVDVAELDP